MPRFRAFFLLAVLLSSAFLFAADTKPTPTIHDFTANMKATDGLFPMFWDAKSGHLYLEINKFDQDFLLLTSLPYGLGQNDVGLDRGKIGQGVVVHFTRVGPKVRSSSPILNTDRRHQTRPSVWRSRSRSPSRCPLASRSRPKKTVWR